MSRFDITEEINYEIVPCCSCDIQFALSSHNVRVLRKTRKGFFCPNGHPLIYKGETDEERLKKENAVLRATNTHLDEQLTETRNSRNAHKGVITKIKNRVSKGICPCCNRTFPDLGSHMNQKHPNWSGDDNT